MSDFIIFFIGLGVTSVVGSAVGLLVWGASQERYVSGRHVGADLLRKADNGLRVDDAPRAAPRLIPGGKRTPSRHVSAKRRVG